MDADNERRDRLFEQSIRELKEGNDELSNQTLQKVLEGLSADAQDKYLEKYYQALLELLEHNQAEIDRLGNQTKDLPATDLRELIHELRTADKNRRREIILAGAKYTLIKTAYAPLISGLDKYISVSQRFRNWLRPEKDKASGDKD